MGGCKMQYLGIVLGTVHIFAALEFRSHSRVPAAESLGALKSLCPMSCDSNRKVGVVGHRWSNLTFEKIF